MTMESKDDIELFQSIGLSEQKAKETLKNKQVSNNLKLVITEVSRSFKHIRININELRIHYKFLYLFICKQNVAIIAKYCVILQYLHHHMCHICRLISMKLLHQKLELYYIISLQRLRIKLRISYYFLLNI